MKIVIFGATVTIGRLTVKRMIDDGHHVTAFARHPERLAQQHPNLTLRPGNATDREAVFAAVAGQDAAVITVGAGKSCGGTVRSDATMNVIQAMQAHGVRRLLCQSMLGAHESWSNLNFFWMGTMFGALLAPVFRAAVRPGGPPCGSGSRARRSPISCVFSSATGGICTAAWGSSADASARRGPQMQSDPKTRLTRGRT